MHLIGAIGQPNRTRVGPRAGQEKIVRDARGTVGLNRAVEHAKSHARHDDLCHREVTARDLVPARIHQVRRLHRQQPRLLDVHP